MSNKMRLEGKWQNAKGRIREAWGDLTDDELEQTHGNWDQLVGKIKEKTGETTESIEDRISKILDSMSDSDDDNL
jgi:uncharacterized protein YjbJ (UPF0337 family)